MIISNKIIINGVPQQIYLNLCADPKGTLLFIHGGPGWADAPWAGVVCKSIWGKLNTVHWDQRGCNRSYSKLLSEADFTINQMVDDGIELCAILKKDFKIEKPILVGHSWGSFIAVLMASREPNLFQSYIGVGQLVANTESEPISLKLCKQKAIELGRNDLLDELNAMPISFYKNITTLFRQREIASELGGEFLKPTDQRKLEKWILKSPKEYHSSWTILYQTCESSCRYLWPELIERSLFNEVQKLELPVIIIQSKYDFFTPAETALKWFTSLNCVSSKNFYCFDQSAHWPQIEENKKFSKIVLESENR